MKPLVLLALAALVANGASGAAADLNANRLKQGSFHYRTSINGKDAGEDVLTVKRDPGPGLFEFTNTVSGAFSQQWRAIASTAFKPVSARLSFGEGSEVRIAFDLTYADGRAKGTTRAKGTQSTRGMVPFDVPVPADVVDQRIDWASVMSQDLVSGRHFEFHVFDPGTGVSRISGHMSGPEKVSVPAGTFDAMRIVYKVEKANGAETYQVLTNLEGPHMLLREEFPNGAVTDLLRVEEVSTMPANVSYRTLKVDGLSIFYREAGPKNAPTILLLHGLPSSSRMFEPLFARLSDRYHLVAPDYPGFGHSDWPDSKQFAYTFDRIAETMNHFTEAAGLLRYTLYMQDYGGPVGFRMALSHPERIESLIVQNAVAHNEGLGAIWKTRRAFWADRAANESALRANLLSLQTTRGRHVGSDPDVDRYDPDLWSDEFAFLNQPGQADIQTDLFYDYRTNVESYPTWQAWMRSKQPRMLVIWGKYDPSFDISEPEAYRRDVRAAQVHVLEAGHFALDTAADEIAGLIRGFIAPSN